VKGSRAGGKKGRNTSLPKENHEGKEKDTSPLTKKKPKKAAVEINDGGGEGKNEKRNWSREGTQSLRIVTKGKILNMASFTSVGLTQNQKKGKTKRRGLKEREWEWEGEAKRNCYSKKGPNSFRVGSSDGTY